ncbi:MAG: putative CRISPR-associated protein [Nitrospinae bacterium]|nr:putative CRISPR-associated protein [Nitrospinota bacterium]
MNTLYLCPSGISIIENLKKQKIEKHDDKDTIITFLKNSDKPALMKVSAELNSLLRMGVGSDDKVSFLSSDTDSGEMVAHCLAKTIENVCDCICTVKRIKGLQTDDRKRFDTEGIPNLTETIIKEVDDNRWNYNIVLNATAGFKDAVPYLTFIGMIFHLPIRYIFERSESIIELPPIPIEFDMERLKQLEPVIDEIISDYLPVDDFIKRTGFSFSDLDEAEKDILLKDDGYITLRPTGRILYQRYLQIKGNKVYISTNVSKKLDSGKYDRNTFENLFKKMKDPIHLQAKLHNEVKEKDRIDLDCYKPGSTNERLFFYIEGKKVYICDIFMHDEYESILKEGELLREDFDKKSFTEIKVWLD